MTKCERCEKTTNDVHTCTPRGAWRKGMDEGYKQAIIYLDKLYLEISNDKFRCPTSFDEDQYFSGAMESLAKLKTRLENVLKQGKSDE